MRSKFGWLAVRSAPSFEQSFSDRYANIVDQLPTSVLVRDEQLTPEGQDPEQSIIPDTLLRVYFDYFTLCEEEVHFRTRGKISRSTWEDWAEGIRSNMERHSFRQAWALLRRQTKQFNLLASILIIDAKGVARIVDPGRRQ